MKMKSFILLLSSILLKTVDSKLPFFIGTATSSYQIEGWNRGKSIWDEFTEKRNLHPVLNATNHYKMYKEDVKLMADLGIKDYRFSISWTRIMPNQINVIDRDGLEFYHNLLDELNKYNITPYVTIYHWDLPIYLQNEEINGWLDSRIIDYFVQYSKVLFEEYSSKVKYWMTINEPLTTSQQGYGFICSFAPGICSEENMFLSARNQLLAHAYTAEYFHKNYKGEIGIVINTNWIQPIDESAKEMSRNAMDRMFGWFMDPLIYGKFPQILESKNQPFSYEEQELLKTSSDFLAINHYTTSYIDANGNTWEDINWPQAQSLWLYDAPIGMGELLKYIKEKYTTQLPIYITECGYSQKNDNIYDMGRVHYISGYIDQVIKNGGENLKGFFIWAFLDNFEWASGYNETFGIVNVNFTDYKRTPKLSSYFIKELNNL